MSAGVRLRQRVTRSIRQSIRVAAARLDGTTTIGAPDEHPDRVHRMLVEAGISIEDWQVPEEGFRMYVRDAHYPDDYLGGPRRRNFLFGEKTLEHYVSLELTRPSSDDVLLDVASHGGPFTEIARAIAGSTIYELDREFPHGVHGARVGADAADMPLPDEFADVMTLHCSFDHFEGSADTGFVVEAARVLRPGGRVVILPLYLSDRFGAKMDPQLRIGGIRLDAGMHRFLMPHLGVRFSRVYDAERLQSRVLRPAEEAGLHWRLLRVHGAGEVSPGAYLHFALVLSRLAAT